VSTPPVVVLEHDRRPAGEVMILERGLGTKRQLKQGHHAICGARISRPA